MTVAHDMSLPNVLRTALASRFGDDLRFDEPMAKHTSWRVGGPAAVLFQPRDFESLSAFLRALPVDVPVHWVGLGSNLLVRDAGVPGAVISSKKLPNDLARLDEQTVSATAGIPCTALARQLVRWGLGPSEFFAGIPGSLGGALTMNAGAHGSETWDAVVSVRLMHRDGSIETRDADAFDVGYRRVTGQGGAWFIAATLRFPEDYAPSRERMQALQDKRRDTQPLGLPSCGSVFANPEGDHSARLIEAAGLKGTRIGGAEVSTKHANFIINTGDASAADIEQLISHVAETVAREHGVTLRHEVRFLGEAG
ncbi:MAG: UDP-N-acetylmuramate dehydrogenase [Pseudomonadota bacterium]